MSNDQDDPTRLARGLIRGLAKASLATNFRDGGGTPYASLVMVACDHGANPLLYISDLAEHTKNALRDSRVSLLYDGTGGHDDPLDGPRLTVMGRLEKSAESALTARYIARHPKAAAYGEFHDFAVFRLAVERAHLVGGFGRVYWLDGDAVRFDDSAAGALAQGEADIVTHMNEDHADALGLFAERLLGRGAGDWRMTGIDPEGCDLRDGAAIARLDFESVVAGPEDARAALVALVGRARAAKPSTAIRTASR